MIMGRACVTATVLLASVLLTPSTLVPSHIAVAQTATSIPLSQTNWTPIGPAPAVNGTTDYLDDASGRVTAVAVDPVDPLTLYVAAAGGGVWKTSDAGASWVPTTNGQSTAFMGDIAVAPRAPNVVYAGTGEANSGPSKARNFRDNIYYGRGVLKSVDFGMTWSLVGSTEFNRRTISRIVVDRLNPEIVYVAVGAVATNGLEGNTGIWKSINGGTTWTRTTADLPAISSTTAFSDLVMDPVDSQTLYAAVGTPGGDPANGVYKTTDGGATWSVLGSFGTGASDPAIGRIALAIAPSSPQTLYAAIARPGPPPPPTTCTGNCVYKVVRSDSGGLAWRRVTTPLTICLSSGALRNYMGVAGDYHNTLAVDPINPEIVYAGGICLIRSVDGGASWSAIAQGETDGPHRDHHALVFDASRRLVNGNDGGIWRLDDADLISWTNLNTNLQITQFVGIGLHPVDPDVAYGGTQDTGTVQFQGFLPWARLLRGDGGASAVSTPNTAGAYHAYQVTRIAVDSPNIFRRTDDGGATWRIRVAGICAEDSKRFYPPLAMDPIDTDRLLLGLSRYERTDGTAALRVYETTNAGESWSVMGNPGAACPVTPDPSTIRSITNIDAVAVAPTDVTTAYVAAGGHVYVTTDRGATWQQRDVTGATDHISGLLVDPSAQTAYAARDRFGGGHVFRTTNGGLTWTDVSGDLPDQPANVLVLDPRTTPSTLYVGMDDGVYASRDLGLRWLRVGIGLPTAQVTDLKLASDLNILAAGTHGRGVWEILTPVTGIASPQRRAAAAPVVQLSESAAPDPVDSGGTLIYTAKVTNESVSPINSVVLTHAVPVGASLVSIRPSQGACRRLHAGAAESLVCELQSLPSGAVATVRLEVQVTAPSGSVLPYVTSVRAAPSVGQPVGKSLAQSVRVVGR